MFYMLFNIFIVHKTFCDSLCFLYIIVLSWYSGKSVGFVCSKSWVRIYVYFSVVIELLYVYYFYVMYILYFCVYTEL